jgi:hypothetical protein
LGSSGSSPAINSSTSRLRRQGGEIVLPSSLPAAAVNPGGVHAMLSCMGEFTGPVDTARTTPSSCP